MIFTRGVGKAETAPTRHECTVAVMVGWLRDRPVYEGPKDGEWVCFADFGGAQRSLATLQGSYAVPLDFDGCEPAWPLLDAYTYAAWTTHGHTPEAPRWRVVVPVDRPMTAAEHRATWECLSAMTGGADPAAKDASRLNYLRGACINPQAAQWRENVGALFPVCAAVEVPTGTVTDLTTEPVEGHNPPESDRDLLHYAMNDRHTRPGDVFVPGRKTLFEALWTADADRLAVEYPPYQPGQEWDHTAADLALANDLAFYTAGNQTRMLRLLIESPLMAREPSEAERERKALYIVRKACNGRTKYAFKRPTVPLAPKPEAPPAPPEAVMQPVAAPEHALTVNRKGEYEATLPNLVSVLGLQTTARIGYDRFRWNVMLAPAGTDEWRPVTDTDMVSFRETLERQQGFAAIGKELMRDALRLVAERHAFDTAQVWLSGLTWDGVPRVERFLAEYCGAEDTPYTRAVSRYIWTGLAARIQDPGCQLDMVVALQSPQGKFKSTGLQALVPSPEFFSDGLTLHEDDDNFKRLIRGKLVVEIAEMAGISQGDAKVIKRTITRRVEEWIEKYETQFTRYPRRCMLFATTNEPRFLPVDDTGQRRWLPVEVSGFARERITEDREQLWAEGAALYAAEGIAYRDAEELAKPLHQQYEQRDVWQEDIERWLDTPQPPATPGAAPSRPRERPLAVSEVLSGALKMRPDTMNKTAEMRAARVLKALGFTDSRIFINGKKVRRWTL